MNEKIKYNVFVITNNGEPIQVFSRECDADSYLSIHDTLGLTMKKWTVQMDFVW